MSISAVLADTEPKGMSPRNWTVSLLFFVPEQVKIRSEWLGCAASVFPDSRVDLTDSKNFFIFIFIFFRCSRLKK